LHLNIAKQLFGMCSLCAGRWITFPSSNKDLASMRIIDIREETEPIASPIANAYFDFPKVTRSPSSQTVVRNGRTMIGYGLRRDSDYGWNRSSSQSGRMLSIPNGHVWCLVAPVRTLITSSLQLPASSPQPHSSAILRQTIAESD
jgi:hypothetical protein